MVPGKWKYLDKINSKSFCIIFVRLLNSIHCRTFLVIFLLFYFIYLLFGSKVYGKFRKKKRIMCVCMCERGKIFMSCSCPLNYVDIVVGCCFFFRSFFNIKTFSKFLFVHSILQLFQRNNIYVGQSLYRYMDRSMWCYQ